MTKAEFLIRAPMLEFPEEQAINALVDEVWEFNKGVMAPALVTRLEKLEDPVKRLMFETTAVAFKGWQKDEKQQ